MHQIQIQAPPREDQGLLNRAVELERREETLREKQLTANVLQQQAEDQDRYERLRVINVVREREAELQRQQIKWLVVAAAMGFLIGWADRQRAEERGWRYERVRDTGPSRRADGGQGSDNSEPTGGDK